MYGTSNRCGFNGVQTPSYIADILIVPGGGATYRIEQRFGATNGTQAQGQAVGFGTVEIYTTVSIAQLA